MDSLIAVLFGWLLGIMGQRPIIYVQQAIKRPSIKRSIIAELIDIRYRLAATSYLLLDRIGELDKPFLEWIHPILKSYDGFYKYLGTSETVEKLLIIKEGDFEALRIFTKSQMNLNKGINLRIINSPFINSNYAEMHLFGISFQNNIIEVLAQIANINDEIGNARYYFYKTFDSGLSEINATIVRDNLEASYKNIAKMSISAAKNISNVLKAT